MSFYYITIYENRINHRHHRSEWFFLAEFLLEKGYDVHGTIRRSSVDFRERIAHLEGHPNFHLHYADLGDSMSIMQVVSKIRPDEIYNLAAQSHV